MQTWLTALAPDSLLISVWVMTEFSAALTVRLRAKEFEASHRADALAAFARLCDESFANLRVSGLEFRTAARFADQ